jgi:hypothetical protein
MSSSDQLTVQERIELLAAARDAWDRAPQNTMKAVFEWRGKNYVVSHSSVQPNTHRPVPEIFPVAGFKLSVIVYGVLVCTENLIRVDDVMESPKLAE